MIHYILSLEEITEKEQASAGGKAAALGRLISHGILIPRGICITAHAYHSYMNVTGLRERIMLELSRKEFQDMRWEEIWDCSLRIRNMFLTTAMPADLAMALREPIVTLFGREPVAVRSSSPDEDSGTASFAGLHESYINISGPDAILEHVIRVWASLWSDAALLYRREFNLTVEKSAMAVIVQELVKGEKSGVVFAMNPLNEHESVVEAVYGLNQAMVDGTVEPDRWILEFSTGRTLNVKEAVKEKICAPLPGGTGLIDAPAHLKGRPVLNDREVMDVFNLARECTALFGRPQDVEWTIREKRLYCLQSRPITRGSTPDTNDKRPWYMSLRRSFENLKALQEKIETTLLPAMRTIGDELDHVDLHRLDSPLLAREIERRKDCVEEWTGIYWEEFIPFAHGMRLFGQVYNDRLRPADPYEFVSLLVDTPLLSLERNILIEDMAGLVRMDRHLQEILEHRQAPLPAPFAGLFESYMSRFGFAACTTAECTEERDAFLSLILKMAGRERIVKKDPPAQSILQEEYLRSFSPGEETFAGELLELARSSYRLRDDDNLYLGRIENHYRKALGEGKRRVCLRTGLHAEELDDDQVPGALMGEPVIPRKRHTIETAQARIKIKARQLTGQPAGPGLARGTARVIMNQQDLWSFNRGEIFVCDAIDPSMTLIVPMAAAIVERRGGMLIHGAIIAREYGIPCVTGITDATDLIFTGDDLTVDGYRGIIVLHGA